MMPLIYTNITYTIIFGSVFGMWAISELAGPVKWSQSKQGRKRDRGSILIGTVLGLLGVVFALWFPLLFPNAFMGQPVAFFIGIALIVVGIYWRWYAIRTLGRFFTATVIIQENQRIITHGPYRLIRHPSYSGVLLIIAGFGCMIGNWISFLCIVSGLFIPLLYRIAVEERELLHAFEEEYEGYMQRTKRLIPFIF